MKLSQAEIRHKAIAFAAEWKDESSENAEAQSFWTELFAVFGIKRRSVASFEERVRNAKDKYNRIDVFYSGVMLGEHKSKGEDLTKAQSQAFNYIQDLTREGRDDIPQYIVLSDFENIVVFDLDSDDPSTPAASFKTAKLHENTRHLAFLTGQITRPIDPEDPINIKAVSVLGDLHDALEAEGYTGHNLERFLVRILFMLFADDTGIFDQDTIKLLVQESRPDGFTLGAMLNQVFEILDKPKDQRQGLPPELAELPFVNGKLYQEQLPTVNFNPKTRQALLDACDFNWSRISPAVFGSLFQSIMASEERRQIGAHYTSERDIMKLINSLFLDDLKEELDKTTTKPKLLAFQDKLASLKLLDPACGCGNFLVVAYRELRLLEIEVLKKYHAKKKGEVQQLLNLDQLLKVNVDQMHGIEIEEWPARIAEVAMWLIDHQMNTLAGETFGQPVLRLPLKKSAKIHHGNALRTDWNEVLQASECDFVLGNPPFIGSKHLSADQREDVKQIWSKAKGSGLLDYVTCWYARASRYLHDANSRAAFVSTNSVSQGEQAGAFWNELYNRGIKIDFAHNTFPWMSEARGKAHVHVVIIGFGKGDGAGERFIVEYDPKGEELGTRRVSNISPYLVEGPDQALINRSKPLCDVPSIGVGNKPIDDGHYLFTPEEKEQFLIDEPNAAEYFRRWYGAKELLQGVERWCLWLGDVQPNVLRSLPKCMERIALVKEFRLASKSAPTRKIASTPTRFHVENMPSTDYLAIPLHSSENREWIPFGFLSPENLSSNACAIVSGVSLFHFGVMQSSMHMGWVRTVCGRIKSDYRYSAKLVYNNYPWPQSTTEKQTAAVEYAAQAVLDARDKYLDQTLADLYDPLAMHQPLGDAHRALDRAVDKCYRKNPFDSERARVEHLFTLYQQLTQPLTAPAKKKRRTPK